MLLVTFHGGQNLVNNVYAYNDSGGDPLEKKVLKGADYCLKDAELRCLVFAFGHLYVANGRKDSNTILRFKGAGTRYEFNGVFASREGVGAINSLLHPYAVVFDGSTYCYISNQDTNVVARLQLSDGSGKTVTPAPIPPALPLGGKFFQGTFVACSLGQLPGLPPTTPVATSQGLAVRVIDGKIQHSVRDLALVNDVLYVCDEAANSVKVYHSDGRLKLKSKNTAKGPAHLLAHAGRLFASGDDAIMAAPLGESSLEFAAVDGVDEKGPSGMAFNLKGDKFFVADRKKREVHRYDVSSAGTFSNKKKIIANMPDDPEFLIYAQG
jgi:hypothetical protein